MGQRIAVAKTVAITIAAVLFLAQADVMLSAESAYTIQDVGTLGGTYSFGRAINSEGHVVGYSETTDHVRHAFFYDGTIHDLGTLGGFYSDAYGINSKDQIVGIAEVVDLGFAHDPPFLFDGTMHRIGEHGLPEGINNAGNVVGSYDQAYIYDGTYHDLGTLGGSYSEGHAINSNNQVAGASYTASDTYKTRHAFLYDGTMKDLGTLGGGYSVGYAINDHSWIVGQSAIAGDIEEHAFLYDDAMHDLGTLGGTISFASGINLNGIVVGSSDLSDQITSHAFVYSKSEGMIDLNSLIDPSSGWALIDAYGINDMGAIVGEGLIESEIHAFILTPVPESSGIVLAITGVVAIALFVHNRRRYRNALNA